MQIHQLSRINTKSSQKKKRRVGRGGKRGGYSGKGQKGQKSRAGAKIKPQIREMILKFPKKRGVHFSPLKESPVIVKLESIVTHFPQGGIITPAKLEKAGLLLRMKSKQQLIKILGSMPLTQSYTIKNLLISQKAKEAIEKAGGKIQK